MNNKEQQKTVAYESPKVEVIEVQVEHGFIQSLPYEDWS